MKSLISTVLVLMFFVQLAAASEKIRVAIREDTVSVQVGKYEYITDLRFESLKAVRVWRGCDDLFYDLTAEGMSIESNYGKHPREMSKRETDLLWLSFQKKFLKLKDKMSVDIIERPKLKHL